MNTKDVMSMYDVSWRTVQMWRRGYYIRRYRNVTEKVYLLPDKSKLPCKFIAEGSNIKKWSYLAHEVKRWHDRVMEYRKNRREGDK